MIIWVKNHKRIVFISILVLVLLIALWIFWPGKQEDLTEAEQAAFKFYKAINIEGDAKTASEMDLNGHDWEGYVRKSSDISSVKIMTPAENEVYILEPDGSGYILTMVKKNGWKMAKLKTERDLNVFVNQVYPDYDWKEVSLP